MSSSLRALVRPAGDLLVLPRTDWCLLSWTRGIHLVVRTRDYLVAILHPLALLRAGGGIPTVTGCVACFIACCALHWRGDGFLLSFCGCAVRAIKLVEAGVSDCWVRAALCGVSLSGSVWYVCGVGLIDRVDPSFFCLEGCVVDGGLADLGVC